MRMESQIPIVGSALVGGMAQSYLIQKYPTWSWMLSLAMIGGGIMLGSKPGWMESVGLGLAASGASGLGTALVPVEGTARAAPGGLIRRPISSRLALPVGRPAAPSIMARTPQFENVQEW